MTELEAVNAILVANGRSHVRELPTLSEHSDAAYVLRTLNTMRFVVRELGVIPSHPECYTGTGFNTIAPLIALCAKQLENIP